MPAEFALYVIIFLFGIVIGSFSNVLICRLPVKENIVTHRSHCMSCGEKIQWYDLVPLVSYMILRGKCRHCGAKISIQYPFVEFLNGAGYVLIFAVHGWNLSSILYSLLFTLLIVISVIDFRTYEIPVGLNISIGVLAVMQTILDYPDLLVTHVVGFFAVSFCMLVVLWAGRFIVKKDAFGGGDIKLMAAAGLMIGWKNIIFAFLLGCILGAVLHLIMMRLLDKGKMLAFGPYLSMGIMIAALWGNQLINWYLGFLYVG